MRALATAVRDPLSGPATCQGDGMRFRNDANPLLITVFLVVWIIVGVLQILSHF
jgi:hypothetical protein